LDKVVYDILKKDFAIGLLYIAISRTRTIKGIIFDESFEINVLRVKNTKTHIYRIIDIVKRILQ
ncbi:hypothetical protein GE21DRAFT_1219551, partial [Neurospora crassa]